MNGLNFDPLLPWPLVGAIAALAVLVTLWSLWQGLRGWFHRRPVRIRAHHNPNLGPAHHPSLISPIK